jgi:hypothetical protein
MGMYMMQYALLDDSLCGNGLDDQVTMMDRIKTVRSFSMMVKGA